jgi:hypothetical protein
MDAKLWLAIFDLPGDISGKIRRGQCRDRGLWISTHDLAGKV